jgi:hypothetical protein
MFPLNAMAIHQVTRGSNPIGVCFPTMLPSAVATRVDQPASPASLASHASGLPRHAPSHLGHQQHCWDLIL